MTVLDERADKVAGRAVYAFDIALPAMLHAKLLRCPHPHARIRHIETAAAQALPGVVCVVTGQDVARLPDPYYGVFLRDQPLLAIDRARYAGDPVAAVVARDEATAFRALNSIEVEYEELPALPDMDAALAPGAPLLFDEPTRGMALPVGPACVSLADPAPNVLYEYRFAYGDADGVLAGATHVFTDSFAIGRIAHFHLEPQVNVAAWRGGRVELWSCNQDPFVVRADIARIFGLRAHDVRVHTPLIGGGFGGKSYCKLEPLTALLARHAGAPVRLALTMDESLLTLVKHPARLTLQTGVDASGRLLARRAEILLDGGAYADASVLVAAKTGFRIGGAYRWQALAARARIVRTTTVPSGSFRGFGGTQAAWASERQMDLIAHRLALDPLALRQRNLLPYGAPFAPNDSAMDCDLGAGLAHVAEIMGQRAPGRGIGYAVGLKDAGGTGNHAQAVLRVTQSAEVMVHAALTEIGQGGALALCRIAAECLGLPLENVSYAELDTEHSPPDNGTHVSCGTMVTGRAVEAAAEEVRRQILDFAAARLEVSREALVLDGWAVRHGNTLHPLEPMLRSHYGGVGWEFIGRGVFKEPYDPAAPLLARNMCWMPCWSAAEVSVDTETGLITVHRLVVAADAGRALDVIACEGQLEGAAAQAYAQALFEELRYRGAMPENATPLRYRVPRAADLPRVFISLIEQHGRGPGPNGVKGIGEAGMLGIAAAIANAVQDATGAVLTDMPFTPERVLAALDQASDSEPVAAKAALATAP
jgi:CO/xanthine dehydrogenase Mo-binding subunit